MSSAVASASDRGEMRARALYQRHARTEAREDLRELQPDRTSAEHEHRFGQLFEIECAHVVDPIFGEARNRRHGGAGPARDQHAFADELAPVHA